MDRRGFLKGLGALIGGVALAEAIPFERVWSFPSVPVVANIARGNQFLTPTWITREALRIFERNLTFVNANSRLDLVLPPYSGSVIKFRQPERYIN